VEYRRLSESALVVSEIGLGSWLTYGDRLDYEHSRACIERAVDLGITLFDTANVYGRGEAETFLGRALSHLDRSSYVLATKVFFPMSRTDMGLSAEQVFKQCDASLARLGTDYIDLYQCHRFDTSTPLEETMDALAELKRSGKVLEVGFSEWNAEQIRRAVELSHVVRFASSQPRYSVLKRDAEAEIFPVCASNGIGQLCWQPLEQGVLTGKYGPAAAPPERSRAALTRGRTMGGMLDEAVLKRVLLLSGIAREVGLTTAQLALAWVLREPVVASALVGATAPEQLDENVGASGVRLDDATLTRIDEAVAGAEALRNAGEALGGA
jgi:aryl-alcohol dehydrogenase-like predicted oxidoreductase